jgi:hypothetical protein
MDLNKLKFKFPIFTKERLLREGLVTTLIGLVILGFGAVLMYQEKANPIELTGWFGLGLLFLRSKDSLIGLPKNNDWKSHLTNDVDDYSEEDISTH